MKRLTIAVIGATMLLTGPGLQCVLPLVSVDEVMGGEQRAPDVYMIQTQLIDGGGIGGGIRALQNEDAWLYLMSLSTTLQAHVTGLSCEARGEAVLSMFPNAISVLPVEPGYRHIPLFNIVVIGILLAAVCMIWRIIRGARLRISAALVRCGACLGGGEPERASGHRRGA